MRLVHLYKENKELIDAEVTGDGSEGSGMTVKEKNTLWNQITNAINAMGVSIRTREQVKRKLCRIKKSGI